MLQSTSPAALTMTACNVLVVAGTHGNEVNAPWLLEQWQQQPTLIATHGMTLHGVIGNPAARAAHRRYIERDLNRSFSQELLDGDDATLETSRARALLERYGPAGSTPCQIAVDLHSTTAAMGNCLVLYGRRPADLALAALVQGSLGLPVYLHEGDVAQTGFLVERWPCGLVIEVGPVPQALLDARIVQQTRLALEACLMALASAGQGRGCYPRQLIVYRHLGSRDLPRDDAGQPEALVHPRLQNRDWHDQDGTLPLLQNGDGSDRPERLEPGMHPVFVNEAAYAEKGIAFSLTKREVWPLESHWCEALKCLLTG